MNAIRLSQDIRPVTDLKSHGADLVRQVTEERRPVVLSRHGRAVAVLVGVEEYEEMRDTLARVELARAVAQAEAELDAGKGVPHAEAEARLQKLIDGGE